VLLNALFRLALLQGPPATDVYVAELSTAGGRLTIGVPRNATRRSGYDNQPTFLPDGSAFLYTCVREGGQADICRHDLATNTNTQVTTTTAESEYSATPLPDGGFAVVRVERDSTQRLWRFDASGTHASLMLERVRPVGYFAFGDDHTLGLFVLGRPATLQIADLFTGRVDTVASDIGRTIRKIPGRRAISYVQHVSDQEWWISAYDFDSRSSSRVVRTLEGVDFYTWTADGGLMAGGGSKLFLWKAGAPDWEEIADLTSAGLTSITRLAISPRGDRIAIVAIPDSPDTP
jgi:hypothetical protein